MPKDGSQTRERILDSANSLFVQRGISGTSIDRIAQTSGLTKGSFFYHFKDKDELLLALVQRFAEEDRKQFDLAIERVERLGARDPLQRLLLFVGVFVDEFSNLEEPPACLYATYLYENGIVSPESMAVVKDAMLFWRSKLHQLLVAAKDSYPPVMEVDLESLADLFTASIEGAFIMSQILDDPLLTSREIVHYRNYLELLFSDTP